MLEGSGLYYLQSRYYDPNIGRFINADAFAATGQGLIGNNMFAYCNNNPIICVDSLGTRPLLYTGSEETPVERAWSLEQMRPSILKEYEEIGVHFIPNWDGNGGKIVNSYK